MRRKQWAVALWPRPHRCAKRCGRVWPLRLCRSAFVFLGSSFGVRFAASQQPTQAIVYRLLSMREALCPCLGFSRPALRRQRRERRLGDYETVSGETWRATAPRELSLSHCLIVSSAHRLIRSRLTRFDSKAPRFLEASPQPPGCLKRVRPLRVYHPDGLRFAQSDCLSSFALQAA